MKVALIELPIATRDGIFLAHYSPKGLAELDFPHDDGLVAPSKRAVNAKQIPLTILRWHRLTTEALKKILAGRPPQKLPPFDWTGTTEFQQEVWKTVLRIRTGKTKSYGEIAEAIDHPRAVRAVGNACGSNPIPILVPCHRVIATGNKIGGYGSDLEYKRNLLKREGIEF
jgi:O-6-methylguanine DNA methyltransferase